MNPQGALTFLIHFAFNAYIFLVLTRFILQAVRADFFNPVSQFVVRATNPPLVPLRKLIPGWGGLDNAALLLTVLLILAKIWVLVLLGGYATPSAAQFLLITLQQLASLLLDYIFWAILIRVILSWVAPDPANPFTRVVIQITEPVMAPARRLLPPIGGLDLSPIVVLLLLEFIRIFLGV